MSRKPELTPGLIALMAVGSGLSVASNYYVQPLLDLLSQEFALSSTQAGLIVTVSQLGYLAGLICIVPLGDHHERRKLLTLTTALTAAGLMGMAFAQSFGILLSVAVVVGLTSVTAQILVPLAAHLATPAKRGATVSTVMSGLLIGILLARTFAGLVAEWGGWRAVYMVAAILMAMFSLACYRFLPHIAPTSHTTYRQLYVSILHLFRDEPVLRRRGFLGGMQYAVFGILWTSMAFMLVKNFHYSEGVIGMFGLLGAVGALTAKFAGRLADRGWARLGTGGFILMTTLSWWLLYSGQWSIIAFGLGVVFLDLGVQGAHISNQSEIYRLNPDARSRLTTGYMSCYFLGGAAGSALSATFYGIAGWSGVCMIGAAVSLVSFLFWAVTEFRMPLKRMRHAPGLH
ncbi:MFS transporter [Thalassospira sp. NFXS8]|uniref:MFS transporter n=1 Tax=Thalassospira sp. NFXS8 TaxID=2819093 RepID=UPI0032E01901